MEIGLDLEIVAEALNQKASMLLCEARAGSPRSGQAASHLTSAVEHLRKARKQLAMQQRSSKG